MLFVRITYLFFCLHHFTFGFLLSKDLMSLSFSDPSKTAIHRVLLLFSEANLRAIVSGMQRIAPIKPSKLPQKIRERITTNVESPSFNPINFGSITFPTT